MLEFKRSLRCCFASDVCSCRIPIVFLRRLRARHFVAVTRFCPTRVGTRPSRSLHFFSRWTLSALGEKAPNGENKNETRRLTVKTEIQQKLEQLAYERTTPFCYGCYIKAPKDASPHLNAKVTILCATLTALVVIGI